LVGTSDGDILVYSPGGALTRHPNFKAGQAASRIFAVWSNDDGRVVVTGDSAGRICVWDEGSQEGAKSFVLKLNQISDRPSCIRSVCLSDDRTKILVGTQDCEVVEVQLERAVSAGTVTAEPLLVGHFKDELWGLSVNPAGQSENEEYCTVGDDGFLRIWSVHNKKQIHSINMKVMARCCCYSPDGRMIAVGYGGRVGKGKQVQDGMFRVYQRDSLEILFEARESKKWISEVRFSQDGRFLAVGAHDNCIYMYSVPQQFKRKFKFSKHNSYISHFDFSLDGRYMQSNCGAYELLFSDTSNGQQINDIKSLSDTEWASWTCTLGWPVQGIWPPGADGTDINAVDRSPSGTLLATADDFGLVKLFRYPCASEKAKFCEFRGHSSHVTNVRWNANGRQLLSVGGNDKCVFVWKVTDR
jgi:microtubule-associated protein-like 6